jgi:metal-responsive CopG/Arc/MetJ family transcriptional regulator
MNFSNVSDKFPKRFVDELDDMLTENTSEGRADFVDDLLDLVSERLESLKIYYDDGMQSVQYYQRQIMERKVKSPVQQDRYTEVTKFLGNDAEIAPDYC